MAANIRDLFDTPVGFPLASQEAQIEEKGLEIKACEQPH